MVAPRNTETIMTPSVPAKCIPVGRFFYMEGNTDCMFIRIRKADMSMKSRGNDNTIVAFQIHITGAFDAEGRVQLLHEDNRCVPLDIDLFDGQDLIASSYQE